MIESDKNGGHVEDRELTETTFGGGLNELKNIQHLDVSDRNWWGRSAASILHSSIYRLDFVAEKPLNDPGVEQKSNSRLDIDPEINMV